MHSVGYPEINRSNSAVTGKFLLGVNRCFRMSLLLSVTTVCRKRSRYSPGNVSVGSDVSDEPAEKGILRSAQSPALGSPVEKLEPWTRLHWLVLRHQRVGEPVEKQRVNNPIYTWKTRPVAPVCWSHQTAKYSNCHMSSSTAYASWTGL